MRLLVLVTPFIIRNNDENEKAGKPWYQAVPRFIIWFIVAILVNTYLLSNASLIGDSAANVGSAISGAVNQLAKHLITLSLFFIGAGLTRKTLKAVGIRPLIQGILLWITISCVSLAYIHIIIHSGFSF